MMDNNQYRRGGGQRREYNIDICMCIDKTGSMRPIIDTVKQHALNLYRDITDTSEHKGKHVGRLRIRVIWFGDYLEDGGDAMVGSDFMEMPEHEEELQKFVNGISAYGGGDVPEDGLEALTYAIKSKWCDDGWKRRHIIALFTDAPAHDLGFCKASPYYPKKGMPKSFGELSTMWGDDNNPGLMNSSAKRLLLFAPNPKVNYSDDKPGYWKRIADNWDQAIIHDVKADCGLQDISYTTMLNVIVNSI